MKKAIKYSLVFGFILVSTISASSLNGKDIFQQVRDRSAGYNDINVNVVMITKETDGTETTRNMEIKNIELPESESRTLISFLNPADVKGTKLLACSYSVKDDEQWIYLPSFNRVKRISKANVASSFMGSEFSYEDINSLNPQVPKFSYKYLRIEKCNSLDCFMIERTPLYSNSGYKREAVWVDTVDYLIRKVVYYDNNNSVIKTLEINSYEKYLTKLWRPTEMTMNNVQNKRITKLLWNKYQFKKGLKKSLFDESVLKR